MYISLLPVQIPAVAMNDDGKIVLMSEEDGQKQAKEQVNKEKRKLTLKSIPLSLTCILHKNYILADPTAEEESIIETHVTIVLDTSGQLISLYKPGGPVLAFTSAIQVSLHNAIELKGGWIHKLMLITIVVASGLCCLDQAKSKGAKELLRPSKFCYGG